MNIIRESQERSRQFWERGEEAPKEKLMPISGTSHSKPYIEPSDLHEQLQDVVSVLKSLSALNVNLPLKKRMLVHAIWEVNQASGSFKSRYRSLEVIKGSGVAIQRDHVFQKKALVERLLLEPHNVEDVVQSALSCVVTKEEHEKLTQYSRVHPEVDGWARYQNAGITVYDMLTGTKLSHGKPTV